jgi:CubicO group peptidase (beta-lactamase class C family)
VRLKQLARRTGALLLLALPLALAGSAARPVPGELAQGDTAALDRYLGAYIPQLLSRHHVPGMSLALVDENGVLWARGFGYADPERGVRATPDTVYQVGSISKVVTAAAVMAEVERGRLALDAPLQRYVPEFSMRPRWGKQPLRPTLRELLSHHSGLPTYYLKGFFSRQPLADLVAALREEYPAYPARETFNYSNTGIDLAGLALERVVRRDFVAHLQRTWFDPLGMTRTSFALDERLTPQLARGHLKGRATEPVTIRDVPAGGLFSSAADLAQFMRLVLRGGELGGRRLLRAETVAAMLTPQFPDTPLDFGQQFGLGWMLSGIPLEYAGRTAWHNGGTKTFMSQMLLLPDRKLGVIALANADSAAPAVYEAAEEVLRAALVFRDGLAPPAPAPRRPAVTLPVNVLDGYAGDYSLMGALARVERVGTRLKFHVLGHHLDLVPVSDRHFRAEYDVLGLFRVPIPFPPVEMAQLHGRAFLLMRDRGIAMTGEKIPPYIVPDTWRRRAGEYRLVNADKDYLVDVEHTRLSVRDDKMLMQVRIAGLEDRDVQVVLVPLGDDAAFVFGLGRNVGDVTTAFTRDGRDYTRYSGYVFERVTPARQ